MLIEGKGYVLILLFMINYDFFCFYVYVEIKILK